MARCCVENTRSWDRGLIRGLADRKRGRDQAGKQWDRRGRQDHRHRMHVEDVRSVHHDIRAAAQAGIAQRSIYRLER